MTTATSTPEHTLLSSSIGQSVLDSIVQANLDLRTVSVASLETLMQAEQRRRLDAGWCTADHLHTVCG